MNQKRDRAVVFSTTCVACFLLSATGLLADQTSGLRISALDKATGQQKEVRLYNKSYAVIIGIDQSRNLPMDGQISYAGRDAKGVQETIEKDFKVGRIIILYDKDATRVAALQREMDRFKTTGEAALTAQDEQARRKGELEKKALEARLTAEQLKQQVLEDERKKRERDDQERGTQEAELDNMLRAELKGNSFTPETFMVAQAYVIDDAITSKQYDVFSSQFVDLGNGTLYHTTTKLIWSKKGNEQRITWYAADDYIKRLNQQAYLGFRDWRMPTKDELITLVRYARSLGYGSGPKTIADFLNKEGFSNITAARYWTSTVSSHFSLAWDISFKDGGEGTCNRDDDYNGRACVVPVRYGR